MERVELIEQPELRHPSMIVAFAGWPNAADVATRTVGHLVDALGATRVGSLRADDCYDLTSARPQTRIVDGLVEEVELPNNTLHAWRDPLGSADLLLLTGVEPGLHWDSYIGALLALCRTYEARRLISLGSLYDRVPHTRPPRVSAVVSRREMKEDLARLGCSFIDYSGPSSMHTALMMACRRQGLDSISLWGHAPHYAHMAWNPRVTYGLLSVLCPLLGINPDTERVRSAAGYLDEMLEKLLRDNADLRAHIAELEETYAADQTAAEPLEPLSDTIIRQVEELLRRRPEEQDEGT
jgi:proteasome assembly chaperone (PAC2) family protein